MAGKPPTPISPRQRRILRAVMPMGFLMLVLWVVWVGVAVASGEAATWRWISPILGLVTSTTLIVSGYLYRKNLRDHDR